MVIVTYKPNYDKPRPSKIVQRCKFNSRYRQPGESVSMFVSQLRSLTKRIEGMLYHTWSPRDSPDTIYEQIVLPTRIVSTNGRGSRQRRS